MSEKLIPIACFGLGAILLVGFVLLMQARNKKKRSDLEDLKYYITWIFVFMFTVPPLYVFGMVYLFVLNEHGSWQGWDVFWATLRKWSNAGTSGY